LKDIMRVWEELHQYGSSEDVVISEDIQQSWDRSEQFGVDPHKRFCDVTLSPDQLQEKREKNSSLLEQGVEVINMFYQYLGDPDFVLFLEDRDNYVLARVGGEESVKLADYSMLVEGSKWSEEVMGTTVSAIAKICKEPVFFYGYENYCRVAAVASTSASPIFDDRGRIIGILGVAAPYHLASPYILGMAITAARAIERKMALQTAYLRSEVANLYKTTIIESMSEGVLTMDCRHRITHLNLIAARSLGIDRDSSLGKRIEDVLLPGNDPFFAKIFSNKRLTGETLIIKQRKSGVKLAVSSTPLIGANSSILGTVVILQPMKQYKRLIERISGARANITFSNIIGKSDSFKYALMCAEMAAKSDSNVLLLGESGVGKDMFAQAIHNASKRAREPFFAINCAALPRELISSELFGYEDGAFTGARKGGNPGKFELADQGTIFLDEIGELPLELQGSLLRVLEEGAVVRLSGREVIPVNVRIIAASNKNLVEEVQKGSFRLDLYYRLGVMDIKIPALRDRIDDIPELVTHFIKSVGPRLGKKIEEVDERAMDLLMRYHWPGNVRELNNVIERAINIAPGKILSVNLINMPNSSNVNSPRIDLSRNKDALEAQLIRSCLQKHNNNRSKAAEEMGISRTTLYRKMERYRIQ